MALEAGTAAEIVGGFRVPEPAAGDLGYVYVISFSDGTLKVGSTAHPKIRMNEHLGHAEAFGLSISTMWFSRAHPLYRFTESDLIRFTRQAAGAARRREYFIDVDVESVVRKARRLADNRPKRTVRHPLPRLLPDGRRPAFPPDRSVISVGEAADLTGLSRRFLMTKCRERRIGHIRFGRRRGFVRDQFEALLDLYFLPEALHSEAATAAPTPQMSEAAGVEAIREAMRRRRPRRRAA